MASEASSANRREYNPSNRERAFMVRKMYLERKRGRDEATPQAELDQKLSAIREVLAEVFSCRAPRINAITAWQLIRESRGAGPIKENESRFIRAYLSLGTNDTERSTLIDELSEIMGVVPEVIVAVCADTREQCKDLLGAKHADAVQPEVMDHIARTGPIKFLSGGEHTDYDTEIKGAWRAHLRDFLDAQAPRELRSQMKVLCLPGKECLEIPMYLELGFSPENIHGIEGGDRIARTEFMLNARRFGITPIMGHLEQILPNSRERYDVVSLDFTGPICQTYCDIAEHILLKERAFIMVNTLQKRESAETQQRLAALHNMVQQQILMRQQFERSHAELFGGSTPNHEDTMPEFSLQNWRGRVSHLIGIMGSNRPENWQVLASKVRQLPLLEGLESTPFESDGERYKENLSLLLRPILSSVMHTLEENGFFQVSDLQEAWKIVNLSNMVTSAVFGKTFVQHLEKRAYRTKVGEKETEFHTDMAVLRSPRTLYRDVAPAVEFFINALLESIETAGDIGTMNPVNISTGVIRGRAGDLVPTGQGKKSDRILASYGDRRLGSVYVHEILSAATQYYAFLLSCPKDDWSQQATVDRTMITA